MLSQRGLPAVPPSAAVGERLAARGRPAVSPRRAPLHEPGRSAGPGNGGPRRPLYTPLERARRDATRWTLVQGVLAPLQFAVMLVSLTLVLRYLFTGEGLAWAAGSVVVKTLVLYTIMVTGSIWEKVVFGRWLFAPAFFWEDVVSFGVIALHTAYLVAWWAGTPGPRGQMVLALVAYAAYSVNAVQFLAKLRAARRDEAAKREAVGVPPAASGLPARPNATSALGGVA